MRWITPRPILLALTLMLVIGAIAAIELRLDSPWRRRGWHAGESGQAAARRATKCREDQG